MGILKTVDVTFGDKSKDYIIDIGENITTQVTDYIRNNIRCERVMIITDKTVAGLYLDELKKHLMTLDIQVFSYEIEPGESSKSLEVAGQIYSFLAKESFSRSDVILAFGGGVVGDLAGYVAATYKRGIPFIQIPTTLLSQVDSSVGGKVAVNIPEGKNLVGAFYQPRYVLIDKKYLGTLEKDQWLDGLGEIIKYGFIGSTSLYEVLQVNTLASIKDRILDIIEACCKIKRDVVLQDEFDTGLRMTLNFGHTLGHAIEKHYGFGVYSHGQAVAMGMYLMMRQYEQIEKSQLIITPKIKELLERYDLFKDKIEDDYRSYCTDIINDKKVMNGQIHIIVVDKIGEAKSYPLTIPQAKSLLQGTRTEEAL